MKRLTYIRVGYAWLAGLLVLLAACGGTAAPAADEAPTDTTTAATTTSQEDTASAPNANLTDGCVETYDPDVDYFPDKTNLEYAEGWQIEYFDNYKVVTVLTPWQDADVRFQYVLVQCGTPAPEGFEDALQIEVPVQSIVTMSTTHLPHLVDLDVLDRLVGMDSFFYTTQPEVRDMIEAGELAEVGSAAEMNVERVLELGPDVVMTSAVGNPQTDAHPRLLEAGLDVVINAEYLETSPLGQAEWVKFTATLFNQEAAANALFGDIATQYNDLAASVASIEDRPTVLINAPFQGTWYVPGGESQAAQFLEDAGADYLWSDDTTTGSIQLDVEAVFERAAEADYWLNTGTWTSLSEAQAVDERFAEFDAFQRGSVFNNNARTNEYGGNAYWETGVTHPHQILADLIAILHSDVLPEHELVYYQQLQ